MYHQFIKRWTFALIFIGSLIFALPAQAEVKMYEGYGEHYMTDNDEMPEKAKKQAKELAMLDSVEQAKVNVESYSIANKSRLTKDEIITITAGLIYVINKKEFIEADFDGTIVYKCIVIVKMDTDEIPEYVENEIKKRKHKK